MKPPHAPNDKNGNLIRAGDKVRVVGIPDLSGMPRECLAETQPVFEYLLGKYKRVAHFDEYGFAHLDFAIAKGASRGYHGVAIEPFLLQLPRTRKP